MTIYLRQILWIRSIFIVLSFVLIGMICLWPQLSNAEGDPSVIHIVVLANRGKERCLSEWEPTAKYLEKKLYPRKFIILPSSIQEIRDHLRKKDIDFVLTSPALYAELEVNSGIRRIATLIRDRGDRAASSFHGAIFSLSSNTSIQSLEDVRGKSIAAFDKSGFGGYVMQAYELKTVGVDTNNDVKSLTFLESQDAIVDAVLTGKVEVGFARADFLDKIAKERQLNPGIFRVLPPARSLPAIENHLYSVSTRSYPEWPLAVTPYTSLELAKEVDAALFAISPDEEAAKAAGISGWTVPESYQSVHDCLRELRLPPYEGYGRVTTMQAIQKLLPQITIVLVLILGIELYRRAKRVRTLAAANIEMEKRIKERTEDLTKANQALQNEMANHLIAEEKLKEIVDLNQKLINVSPLGIIAYKESGPCIIANPAAAAIIGTNVETVLKQNFRKLGTWKRSEMMELATYALETKQLTFGEFHYVSSFGRESWLMVFLSPFYSGGELHLLCLFQDISKQKEAEQAILQAKNMAETASKSKSEFLANMSHEIRTPMNALLGFAELLSEKLSDPELSSYMAAIISSGKSLLSILNDILDLSKIEAGKLELQLAPTVLSTLVDDVQRTFDLRIKEKGLYFSTVIDPKLPKTLLLDELRLRQVLLNLVGNAIKFTHQGGITLKVESSEIKGDVVDLVFAVVDTGIGIPADQQELIFESFQQQTGQRASQYGGSGLGLAICKRLVGIMSGSIKVQSEVDKGSTFSIYLNNVPVAEIILPIESSIEELNIKFPPTKILIVDDIEYNRFLIKSSLDFPSFTIFEAKNGIEALKILELQAIDLILLDIRMSIMDGYPVLGLLQENPEFKNIPVIIITASVTSESPTLNGFTFKDLLYKPFNRKELLFKIARVLGCEPGELNLAPEEVIIPSEVLALEGPELFRVLKEDLLPLWENCHRNIYVNRVSEFAERVAQVAERYHNNEIKTWAKELSHYIAVFDITKISKLLKGFPGLVANIEKQVNS